jgi:hypothetical protein
MDNLLLHQATGELLRQATGELLRQVTSDLLLKKSMINNEDFFDFLHTSNTMEML